MAGKHISLKSGLVRMSLSVLTGVVLGVAGYEALRVMRARDDTPRLMAAALAKADDAVKTLPADRAAMLVAVEDPTFWTNDGTDFSSPGAGDTTITQGLGKLIYFPNGFRPGLRKIELILIAKFATTPLESKTDILHAFLANAYLGGDAQGEVTGFSQGARRWFGKSLTDISDDQFLALVAMLPAPAAFNPVRQAAANAERVKRIKKLLAHQCAPKDHEDWMLEGCA